MPRDSSKNHGDDCSEEDDNEDDDGDDNCDDGDCECGYCDDDDDANKSQRGRFPSLMKLVRISMGSGKMMVEFFSADIVLRV